MILTQMDSPYPECYTQTSYGCIFYRTVLWTTESYIARMNVLSFLLL